MNTPNTSESDEAASLHQLRSQISTDIEAMHQKETSLREYEQRLRQLVEKTESSQHPHAAQQEAALAKSQTELDTEWEKYQRAHALLEAARRGLCDDRMALKEKEEKFQQREVEVSRREAWIRVREQEIEAQAALRAKELDLLKEKPKAKRRSSFTVAPLLAARKMLLRQT